jgi:hypothetical protein
MFRFPAVISTQVVAAKTRRGTSLIITFSTNTASLIRLTGKLLGAVQVQAAGSGRGGFKLLRAAQAQIAALRGPRSVILQAAQAQIAAATHWFWLFVPAWARQQTSLLPPGGGPAEPPSFGAIDPFDQTTFSFDWSSRADPNDPIVSASVVSVPPGATFSVQSPFISGTLVEATVLPFVDPTGGYIVENLPGGSLVNMQLPFTFRLRCTAVFASGRRSSFSIPVTVQTL